MDWINPPNPYGTEERREYHLVTATSDGHIRIWDIKNKEKDQTALIDETNTGGTQALVVNNFIKQMATGGIDHTL